MTHTQQIAEMQRAAREAGYESITDLVRELVKLEAFVAAWGTK